MGPRAAATLVLRYVPILYGSGPVLLVPMHKEGRGTVHAYVINLARSPERRAHITGELQKTGLGYEIVTGVDGRGVDLHDRTIIDPELLAKTDFPAGTAGCALSHLQVYRKVIADGREHAIVLEDDVILPADLGFIVDQVIPHMTGAEVVLLNYGSEDGSGLGREGCLSLDLKRPGPSHRRHSPRERRRLRHHTRSLRAHERAPFAIARQR